MNIQTLLEAKVKEGFLTLFETTLPTVEFQATRKDFEGDITIVVFPMLRYKKGNPAQIGESLGVYLVENVKEVIACNVVKGFLNLVIDDSVYLQSFNAIYAQDNFGLSSKSKDVVMVEYSSPNTNKPLHLGHVRNNLLGYSVAEILKASGHKVYKTQIINDRGIHICKSMLAWKKFGNSETPDSTGMKGDSFVGKYYVEFNDAYKKEVSTLIANGIPEEEAKKQAPILMEAQEMLLKWEAGEAETVALWKMMNSWVYEGFKITYKNDFELLKKIYKSKYIYISHLHCDHFDFKTLKRFQDKNLSFIIKKFKNGVLKRRLQKLTKKNIHKLECHIEYSLFKALLKRKFPWNTSLSGSTIMYRRIPNKFNVDMMFSLNFLRI